MRLSNQRLSRRPCQRADEVVDALGAVQAQDFPAAKWSLALRMRKTTDREIEESFNAGRILRVHVLRPTWHFVTPSDIRWMIELTSPRVRKSLSSYNKRLELDDALFAKSHEAVTRALGGRNYLTRREIKKILERIGITTNVQRLAHIMAAAELEGLICSGPLRGRQHTYALLEERAPRTSRLPREEALARLCLKYFSGHGPAQLKDFAWWSGLGDTISRAALDSVKSELEMIPLNEKMYWFKNDGPAPPAAPAALLLSIYDEYTIAYTDRSDLSGERDVEKMISMGNAVTAAIVIGGKVTGTWKRSVGKNGVEIRLSPFRKLNKTERAAVLEQVSRYGEFLGMKAIVRE